MNSGAFCGVSSFEGSSGSWDIIGLRNKMVQKDRRDTTELLEQGIFIQEHIAATGSGKAKRAFSSCLMPAVSGGRKLGWSFVGIRSVRACTAKGGGLASGVCNTNLAPCICAWSVRTRPSGRTR
jgi:hypothetical protein